MTAECHAHIFMDGINYRKARDLYKSGVCDSDIRKKLLHYQQMGVRYIRDGGDPYGACERARELAPEYGITYRIPVCALHKKGSYGAIVGRCFADMSDYRELVQGIKNADGDFVKVMLSGILDFDRAGALTSSSRTEDEIREIIHIAHEEGFRVMAHVNGAETIRMAAEYGVDSVEHGFFIDTEALDIMAENRTIWVPTISAVHGLIGTGRFDEGVIRKIEQEHAAMIRMAAQRGVLIASGSDGGAFGVLHGEGIFMEQSCLDKCDADYAAGNEELIKRFQRR